MHVVHGKGVGDCGRTVGVAQHRDMLAGAEVCRPRNRSDCAPRDLMRRCTSAASLIGVAILVVPCRVEALPGLLERVVRFRGVPARAMEGFRKTRDLRRIAGLQALIDRPRISAGLGDQIGNVKPFQLHRSARQLAADSPTTATTLPPLVLRYARSARHRCASLGRALGGQDVRTSRCSALGIGPPRRAQQPGDCNWVRSSVSSVELRGLEPLTPTLPVWCATSCAIAPRSRAHRSYTTGNGPSKLLVIPARRLTRTPSDPPPAPPRPESRAPPPSRWRRSAERSR